MRCASVLTVTEIEPKRGHQNFIQTRHIVATVVVALCMLCLSEIINA
jgi:hypothetical protein